MKRLYAEVDWLSLRLGVKLIRYFNWRKRSVSAGWELEVCFPFVTLYWESKP